MLKLCKVLILATAILGTSAWPSQGQIAALTVGAVVQSLGDLATQLDTSARNLIQQGNSDVAQQQMLAAGIVRQLITQLSDTYKGSLDQTFQKLGAAHSNLAHDIENTISLAKDLEDKTASDAQNVVYKMQSATNQIILQLPFTKHYPVFYGMIVRDIYSDLPRTGVDLELIGLNFTDPDLQYKQPKIEIAGQPIEPQYVSVQGDKIQIALPAAFKSKIGISDDYCLPSSPFSVALHVYYRAEKQFLFIPYGSEQILTFNAFALPAKDAYRASTTYDATIRSKSDEQKSFSVSSGEITYGCEEGNSANISYSLPAGADEIQCRAAWANQSNTKSQSASCAIGGLTVTASGVANGRDRQCIVSDILSGGLFRMIVGRKSVCNCPGGGHGTLVLQGTYHLSKQVEENASQISLGSQQFLTDADIPIPSDQAREVTAISVDIKRDKCDKPFDAIKMALPKEPTAIATQTSTNGSFVATYRNENLHIGRRLN